MRAARLLISVVLFCDFAHEQAAADDRLEEILVTARRMDDASPPDRDRGGPFQPDGLDVGQGQAGGESGGGGSETQIIDIQNTDNGIRITFAEFSFAVEIASADLDNLTPKQKEALVAIFQDYKNSPQLARVFDFFNSQGVATVVIHVGDKAYQPNGETHRFDVVNSPIALAGEQGVVAYIQGPSGPDSIKPGSAVHISINDRLIGRNSDFAHALIHELLHPFVPGNDASEEAEVQRQEREIYRQIFQKMGTDELENPQVLGAELGIIARGSASNDMLQGSPRNDALHGGPGDDQLYGYDGDDLLSGEDGSDVVYGGAGNNRMEGGLSDDAYIATGSFDLLMDDGGADTVFATDVTLASAAVERYGDTLKVVGSNGHVVQVDRYWLPGHRIEYFYFAERMYYAVEIDAIFASPSPQPQCYGVQPTYCDQGTIDQ